MKEFIEQIKILRDTAREKKDQALDLMILNGSGHVVDPVIQEKSSLICRGQEKAFDIILDMLENPDNAVRYYSERITELEKQVAEMGTYERRENEMKKSRRLE